MGFGNFKQADSRWGKKNYNGSSTMATAGCGPTSVANLVYAINTKNTPWTVAQYMKKHGYAIRNNGTAWAGIPAAMKHFGMTNVSNVAQMTDVWKKLKEGYVAVFLMKRGSRGGVTWTTSGHFIAVTDYKTKGGKHYVYTRDSGGRNHTGWYCYETQMKGLIPQIWMGKIPAKKKTVAAKTPTKSTASKPATSKGELIYKQAMACSWKSDTPKSKYRYPGGKRRKAYTEALKKAYGDRKGWGKQTKAGASCDVFVGAVVRSCGVDPKFPRGRDEQAPYLKSHTSKWKRVSRKKKDLKKGDIIEQKYKSGGSHIMIYLGGDKIANAHYNGKTYGCREKYSKIVKPASKCKFYRVYRAK